MFDFNSWQRQHKDALNLLPRIVCADGLSLSVQANARVDATPRVNVAEAYEAVEVGYPSARVPELDPHACYHDEPPTRNIYWGVPVALINQIITAHGGPTEVAS